MMLLKNVFVFESLFEPTDSILRSYEVYNGPNKELDLFNYLMSKAPNLISPSVCSYKLKLKIYQIEAVLKEVFGNFE